MEQCEVTTHSRHGIYTHRAPAYDNFTPITSVENLSLHLLSYYGHVMMQNPFEKYNKTILKYKSMKDLSTTSEGLYDVLLAKYGLIYATSYSKAIKKFRESKSKSLTLKKIEISGTTKKEIGYEMRKVICKTLEAVNVINQIVLENHHRSIYDILTYNNNELMNNLYICSIAKDNVITRMFEISDLCVPNDDKPVTLPVYEEDPIKDPVIEESIPPTPDYNEEHDKNTAEGTPEITLPEIIEDGHEPVTLPLEDEEETPVNEEEQDTDISEEIPEPTEEEEKQEEMTDEEIDDLVDNLESSLNVSSDDAQRLKIAKNIRLANVDRNELSLQDNIELAASMDSHVYERNKVLHAIGNIKSTKQEDPDEILFGSMEDLYYREVLEKVLSTGIEREQLYDNYNVMVTALFNENNILMTYPTLKPNVSKVQTRDIVIQNITSLYKEMVSFAKEHHKECCLTKDELWYSTYNTLFSLLTLLIANINIIDSL